MLPGMTMATFIASAAAGLSTARPAAVPHIATNDLLLMIMSLSLGWSRLRRGSFLAPDSLDQELLIVDIK
jgi:hypothetical protein